MVAGDCRVNFNGARGVSCETMRTVWEYNIGVETSVGPVTGVLWSDGLLAIGSSAEAERNGVSTPADIAAALQSIGLPDQEAETVADTIWNGALATFPERFASRFAKRS